MDFNFSPRWVYKILDGKLKSLIVREEADFKVMIQGGYTDSPKAAEEKKKHPACEAYFDDKGKQRVDPTTIKTDLSIEEVEALQYPELIEYAKKLEGVFDIKFASSNAKKSDVISKIKELRNADSARADK